jgi:hypothetical protein
MGSLHLSNMDLDTGKKTKPAEYPLSDESYAQLLAELSQRKFDRVSPELRANILDFYSDLTAPYKTKDDSVRWQSVLTWLDQLKAAAPVPTSAGNSPHALSTALVALPL